MNQHRSNLALAALLLLWLVAAPQCGSGLRLYKSRKDVMKMIEAKNQTKIFFSNCKQSSHDYSCTFAIDNSFTQTPSQCALTDEELFPWWTGHLETPAYITTVTLLNMNNTWRPFPDALRSIRVSVHDETCFTTRNHDIFVGTYPCDLFGDQVTIEGIDMPLPAVIALCDVEVQGVPLKFPTILDDDESLPISMCRDIVVFPLESPLDRPCEFAISKDPNQCAESHRETDPITEFMLEKPAIITRVALHNYVGSKKPQEIMLMVGDQICGRVFDQTAVKGGTLTIECDGIFSNLVVLRSRDPEDPDERVQLVICEIEVFGHQMKLRNLEKYSYIGCHTDTDEDHDLPTRVSNTAMSSRKCYRMCKRKGFKYFAMQLGKYCYCGDSYGKHGKASEQACYSVCRGNKEEICGGKHANSVYEIITPTEATDASDKGNNAKDADANAKDADANTDATAQADEGTEA